MADDLSGSSLPDHTRPTLLSPRRPLGLLLGIVLLALLIGVLAGNDRVDPALPASVARSPAPAFELEGLKRSEAALTLESVAGMPLVLNFWASWCVPCRRELPALGNVERLFGERIAFLGVNHQDDRDTALQLLEEAGVAYPTGFDPGGQVAREFGLYGMPTTVFISADGEVLERRTGEISESQLVETIQRLFPTRPGEPTAST